MKYSVLIGIDVSKETLDYGVFIDGNKAFHYQSSNDKKGIKKFLRRLKKENDNKSSWLFCLEKTGIYCNHFLSLSVIEQLDVWLEDPVKIKSFHGHQREKNDKIDSIRIAQYALAKQADLRLWEPPRGIIEELKALLKLRGRLVDTQMRLKVPLSEDSLFKDKSIVKEHRKHVTPILKSLSKEIKEIEQKIIRLLKNDKSLNTQYKLVTSVKGVGLIVGANLLVVSNEFKDIKDPRKMACHCGLAPFKTQSGKSVRSRNKVSHRANKNMKTLLNLAARSAVASKGELRNYYLRKVDEAKNKMSVMNAVRNKIVHRVYACIRDNRKYENFYTHALA